ncbi:MAG TPA: SAP domain-containing protein [Streptosporangiaceae bacterium]
MTPYAAATILELRDLCRARGLPAAGTRADLVTRLEEHDGRVG